MQNFLLLTFRLNKKVMEKDINISFGIDNSEYELILQSELSPEDKLEAAKKIIPKLVLK